MADDKEAAEALIAETQKKIKDAFAVFDHEGNSTVDVREIGTIIRSLGCCPSEEELHEMLAEVEEEEPTGYIQFDKFLPMMTKVLIERKYRPQSEEIILRAFEGSHLHKRRWKRCCQLPWIQKKMSSCTKTLQH
ncbi:dynein regulatory complex protein 8 isoform X3 [Amblyraja radiata]|uniref:dynein regulatory complex protein 8 isoform X3 n=1 Tax=Amblyraja radiata TaxID=386614 RepID=UPI0014038F3D|nr:dynein regulatory complex protein 8 isoform X3 [Amblyraja radiata]